MFRSNLSPRKKVEFLEDGNGEDLPGMKSIAPDWD